MVENYKFTSFSNQTLIEKFSADFDLKNHRDHDRD